MSYQVTQNDLAVLSQGKQEIYTKIQLIDKNFKTLDSLEGLVVSLNCSQDSESVQRRSLNLEMVIQNSALAPGKDSKIWLDKRVAVYYGVKSLIQKEILWYKIGTYAYVNSNYTYAESSRNLSLTCADMMAFYDGTLNGQIGGYGSSNSDSSHTNKGLKVPAGESIRDSIIATLKDAGITKYIVEDIGKEVPYDLEFSTGVTYQEVWQTICELYDGWEYFFDADGTFVWREIPTCLDAPVVLDDTIMKKIVIDESASIDFGGIYNVTEVWGKVLELEYDDRYAEASVYTDNVYNIELSHWNSWEDIEHLTMLAFYVCEDNSDSPCFTINGWNQVIPICDGGGEPLKAGVLEKDKIYTFRFRRIGVDDNGSLVMGLFLLGQFQCYGKFVSNNQTDPDNPFNTDQLGYEILRAVDYENLSDDAACYNQAEYLTYTTTAMKDTITLNTLIVPWLEVNQKIGYTPLYNNEKAQYIVKSLSFSIGNADAAMSVTLYKFRESFSYVWNRRYDKK